MATIHDNHREEFYPHDAETPKPIPPAPWCPQVDNDYYEMWPTPQVSELNRRCGLCGAALLPLDTAGAQAHEQWHAGVRLMECRLRATESILNRLMAALDAQDIDLYDLTGRIEPDEPE